MDFAGPLATLLVSALVGFALAVAYISLYRERRYWKGRLRQWQDRLSGRIDVLRMLIADGQETQRSCLTERDPVPAHHAFIDRCVGSLGEHFGALYAARIDTWPSGDWEQPPGLPSDEHVFAWYDIERRLTGLKGLLAEVEDDLGTLDD